MKFSSRGGCVQEEVSPGERSRAALTRVSSSYRSELENLAHNTACDVIGLVTFVGRIQRIRCQGDKGRPLPFLKETNHVSPMTSYLVVRDPVEDGVVAWLGSDSKVLSSIPSLLSLPKGLLEQDAP